MAIDNDSSQGKGSLLERWLNLNKTEEIKTGISPHPKGQPVPLSYGQQKLWFLQQLYPGNSFYNYTEAYKLKGKLNTENFTKSFRFVVDRHHILRTTVNINEGEAVQAVQDISNVGIRLIHWEKVASEHKNEIKTLIRLEADRPFDLNTGPLTRLCLVHIAPDEHLAVVTMHHIVTDEWSLGILKEEWSRFYQALEQGIQVHDEPLPIQYTDYAYWQRAQQPDPTHLEYWRKKLEGTLPILNLPTDRSRPAIPSFKGGFCSRVLSSDLSEKIKSLTKKTNTTMFVFLMAVYKVLLYRYSGQKDILVGTPFNSRDQVSLEKLIGFFIDTLVIRSEISGEIKFTDVLESVRNTSLEAFSHKNLPFEKLVSSLKPERYMNANPLFQVMFVFHKANPSPSFGPTIDFEKVAFEASSAKFDLTLHMGEVGGQLLASFEYAKDLFDRPTIERMQDHLAVLLEGIIDNPETLVADLPILSESERTQILTAWNGNVVSAPVNNLLVHEIFQEHALKQPDNPAVIFKDTKLNYKQLNERADAVAALILEKHNGTSRFIGLHAERSVELIVGILGILKAGCAYLPLDPEYPAERRNFMIKDAGVSTILTHAHLASDFSDPNIQLLTFEETTAGIMRNAQSAAESATVEDTAYIIYTSGSTGKPKGVCINHKNLLHSTLARTSYYPEVPESFLLLSSFAFDSSVAGIFWTLTSGGKLIITENRIEQDISRLADLILTHQVTHTLMLPSLYSLLLQHGNVEKLGSLQSVIVAGEACMPSLCALHDDTLSEVSLYNEYGPTEATVWCTAHKIRRQDCKGPVPIGRPIPSSQIYILDERKNPVPAGVAGELYVGGEGVATSYLNQPEFSKDKFMPNPFAKAVGAKMYRTGDLARFNQDGLIEFLGRADEQVKMRGFRIELNEIKETLKQFDGVNEAAVMLRYGQQPSLINEVENVDTERLISYLETLETNEVTNLLSAVEKLSEKELDLMLDEIKKSKK